MTAPPQEARRKAEISAELRAELRILGADQMREHVIPNLLCRNPAAPQSYQRNLILTYVITGPKAETR